MCWLLSVIVAISSVLSPGFSDPVMTKGIHPEGCPVQILEFKTLARCYKDAHCLGIIWKNISDKEIVACEFRIYCFDALKRLSDFKTSHMFKTNVPPQESHKSPAFMDYMIGSFETSYICVVPERILFNDQSIWQRTDGEIYRTIIDTIKSDIEPECMKKTVEELVYKQAPLQSR